MIAKRNLLVHGAILALLLAAVHPAPAAEPSAYSVKDLLEPCMEGDNDSRGGAVLELECEQYINGFTDAYLSLADPGQDNICLPPEGNRADEVRWAFMRWAHQNFDQRNIPAVSGLMATLKTRFKCK